MCREQHLDHDRLSTRHPYITIQMKLYASFDDNENISIGMPTLML